MRYIVINNNDYLQHHGVKGMKWGVRRYRNADGSLTREGNLRANRVFNTESMSKNNPDSNITKYRRKVIQKYDNYKNETQRKADKEAEKAMDAYLKYVENYSKSNKDVQTHYEHDFDHTKKGKKLLNAVYDSNEVRKLAYAGEDWFWKYARDVLNAELKDYMRNR